MKSIASRAGIALLLLLCATAASADVLVFKDGRRLTGVATIQGDKVELRVSEGTLFFRRDLVQAIETSSTPLQVYEKRRAALKPDDVESRFQLGQYCESNGLRAQASAEFEAILKLNVNHPGARERLGYRLVGGKWLTETEEMRGKGLTKVGDRWLTQEEVSAAQQQAFQEQAIKRAAWERRRAQAVVEAANRKANEEAAARTKAIDDEAAVKLARDQEEKAAEAKRQRDAETWGRFSVCAKCSKRVPEGERMCPGCHAYMGRR